MIKEVIVVEGKDDISAVKAALDVELISTNGYAYGKKLIDTLKKLQKRRGIIIFTDPDYMGKKIRKDISSKIEGCKHAYLPQGKAKKKKDIGVENATPEDIVAAIEKARPELSQKTNNFNKSHLIKAGLINLPGSNERRNLVSDILGIGHGNGKQFLNRLNSFEITLEEFEEALKRIDGNRG